MSGGLTLAVPSKGRLMDQTFDWFGKRGVTLRKAGSDREYAGAVGPDEVRLAAFLDQHGYKPVAASIRP